MSTKSAHDFPLLLTMEQAAVLIFNTDDDTTSKAGNVRLIKRATSVATKNRTRMVISSLSTVR